MLFRSDDGVEGITQCEIDIETGEKLTPSRCIYKGAGGRYLESPHLYKINGTYYMMVAEGGTEYGHMVVYAKGEHVYGPFENYPHNPVLTNRNLGGYQIQGCGHADIVEDEQGNFWMVHLAFRQIDQWLPFHITGREVYLVPMNFREDGWFEAGVDGITPLIVETDRIDEKVVQSKQKEYTFENTTVGIDWCCLRNPNRENYQCNHSQFDLYGTKYTLEEAVESPTFIALRQKEMEGVVTCCLALAEGEAGISFYMNEEHHYDLGLRKVADESYEIVKRSSIGGVVCEQVIIPLTNWTNEEKIQLSVRLDPDYYQFKASDGKKIYDLGILKTRYLSSEVTCGFTGVMIGLYAQGCDATMPVEFTEFKCHYEG